MRDHALKFHPKWSILKAEIVSDYFLLVILEETLGTILLPRLYHAATVTVFNHDHTKDILPEFILQAGVVSIR